MKRLTIIGVVMLVIMTLLVPSVTFAHNDYCYFTEDGKHDFTFISDKTNAHPHRGYRECLCGERIYYTESYFDECEICRLELCEIGIHCYLEDIQYNDEYGYSGYGTCYCGRRKNFAYDFNSFHYEPYPGIGQFFRDELYALMHPHYQYDEETGSFYDEDWCEEYGIIHDGSCGVCNLLDEFSRKVESYEIDMLLSKYGYSYNNYTDEYYEEEESYYHDNGSYDYYEDDHNNESESYDVYYDAEDFYEWLDIAKDVFGD